MFERFSGSKRGIKDAHKGTFKLEAATDKINCKSREAGWLGHRKHTHEYFVLLSRTTSTTSIYLKKFLPSADNTFVPTHIFSRMVQGMTVVFQRIIWSLQKLKLYRECTKAKELEKSTTQLHHEFHVRKGVHALMQFWLLLRAVKIIRRACGKLVRTILHDLG